MITKQQEKRVRKFIAALRSGKYKQTKSTLYRKKASDDYPAGYCCLGVACDVYKNTRRRGDVKWVPTGENQLVHDFLGKSGVLPKEVQDYYGFTGEDGFILPEPPHTTPIDLNDTYGKSFDEIANVFETWLVGQQVK